MGGVQLPPAVSPQVLEDAAVSLGIDPEPLFAELGWSYAPGARSLATATADRILEDRLGHIEKDMASIREDLEVLQSDVVRVLRRLGSEDGVAQ